MVDFGGFLSDENEDFRNKAKVSTDSQSSLKHPGSSQRRKLRSIAQKKTFLSLPEQCISSRKGTKFKSFR